jgi:hypothetical protein
VVSVYLARSIGFVFVIIARVVGKCVCLDRRSHQLVYVDLGFPCTGTEHCCDAHPVRIPRFCSSLSFASSVRCHSHSGSLCLVVFMSLFTLPPAEYDIASLFRVSVLKLFCDQSIREKAWRSRKRGAQAT